MNRMELMTAMICVGLGGFAGSVGRYLLSLIAVKGDFPVITLLTNIAGAVLIGAIVEFSGMFAAVPANLLLFLKTGLCGGFTTFSTFSLETVTLLESDRPAAGALYAASSIAACLAGVVAGRALARAVAAVVRSVLA